MKSILDDLFYGHINPSGRKYSYHYGLSEEIEDMENKLKEMFGEKEKQLLVDCLDAHHALEREIACKNFKYGFKLSQKLSSEAEK